MLAFGCQRQSRLSQNTIEARIVPKVIPHGIQLQIAAVQTKRQLHQFAQFLESAITISRHSQHLREPHLTHWTGHCIHARRKDLGRLTRMTECLFVLAERSLGDL